MSRLQYSAGEVKWVVVDNGSTDRTPEIAKAGGARVLYSDAPRVGGVRNAGVKASDGAIVGFLDADCVVSSEWLPGPGARALADDSVGAVGGVYLENPS
ncbi:MAG: glycosyltransferase family A protein [Gemmatimonadota bacterium]|nr:glycosyltransferase family A protein [Gemmatimonadota bacterium]